MNKQCKKEEKFSLIAQNWLVCYNKFKEDFSENCVKWNPGIIKQQNFLNVLFPTMESTKQR